MFRIGPFECAGVGGEGDYAIAGVNEQSSGGKDGEGIEGRFDDHTGLAHSARHDSAVDSDGGVNAAGTGVRADVKIGGPELRADGGGYVEQIRARWAAGEGGPFVFCGGGCSPGRKGKDLVELGEELDVGAVDGGGGVGELG